MKQKFLLLTALVAINLTVMAATKTVIQRIDPTDWYVGMKNPSLQLMVYGKGVAALRQVTTDYPGVTVDSVVALAYMTGILPIKKDGSQSALSRSTRRTTCWST